MFIREEKLVEKIRENLELVRARIDEMLRWTELHPGNPDIPWRVVEGRHEAIIKMLHAGSHPFEFLDPQFLEMKEKFASLEDDLDHHVATDMECVCDRKNAIVCDTASAIVDKMVELEIAMLPTDRPDDCPPEAWSEMHDKKYLRHMLITYQGD